MQYHFFSKREYTFPWFIWDMYSKVEQFPDTITQTEVFINNKLLDITSIPIWQEETISRTFKMYNWMLMNDYNDPINEKVKEKTAIFPKKLQTFIAYKVANHKEEIVTYPAWLKQYLQKRLSIENINLIEFKAQKYAYNIKENKFTKLDSWTIKKIEY